jgi:multimeric flavodoxin WrbA
MTETRGVKVKALILDGTRSKESFLEDVHQTLARGLAAAGCEVASMTLRDLEIHHCVGCFGCWVQTPGECTIDDSARAVARSFITSDVVVFFTPVTFGGYSAELKKALDRIICVVSPFFDRIDGEVHHKPRYRRYPRLLAVGIQPRPDRESEEIFTTLVARNAINLHAPAHAAVVFDSHQTGEIVEERLQSLIQGLEADA